MERLVGGKMRRLSGSKNGITGVGEGGVLDYTRMYRIINKA